MGAMMVHNTGAKTRSITTEDSLYTFSCFTSYSQQTTDVYNFWRRELLLQGNRPMNMNDRITNPIKFLKHGDCHDDNQFGLKTTITIIVCNVLLFYSNLSQYKNKYIYYKKFTVALLKPYLSRHVFYYGGRFNRGTSNSLLISVCWSYRLISPLHAIHPASLTNCKI